VKRTAVMVEVRFLRLRCATALGLASDLRAGLDDLGLEIVDDDPQLSAPDGRQIIVAFEVQRFEAERSVAKDLERRFRRSDGDPSTIDASRLHPEAIDELLELASAAAGKKIRRESQAALMVPVWAEVYDAATLAPLQYALAIYDDYDADRQLDVLAGALGLTQANRDPPTHRLEQLRQPSARPTH
jgi:hypothetical protein